MFESILPYLLDLKRDDDYVIPKVVWKLLYFFSCIIISFYISELLGYQYLSENLSYNSLINFFASYKILIPVFIFLFVIFSLSIYELILNGIVQLIIRKTYSKTIQQIKLLSINNVLSLSNEEKEKIKKIIDNLKSKTERVKTLDTKYAHTYSTYVKAFTGMLFIYVFIVKTHFQNLYNPFLLIIIVFLYLFLILIFGLQKFYSNLNLEINKVHNIIN